MHACMHACMQMLLAGCFSLSLFIFDTRALFHLPTDQRIGGYLHKTDESSKVTAVIFTVEFVPACTGMSLYYPVHYRCRHIHQIRYIVSPRKGGGSRWPSLSRVSQSYLLLNSLAFDFNLPDELKTSYASYTHICSLFRPIHHQ